MMNIKLSNEDKRNDILVHIREISELDVCLFVDTGFEKMGNVSMGNLLDKLGYNWISVNRRRKNGGIGFMVKKGLGAEGIKHVNPNVLWLKIDKDPPLFIGGVYRSPTTNFDDTMTELKGEMAKRLEEGNVIILGDFNARIGEEPSVVNAVDVEETEDRRTVFPRKSQDKNKNREGMELLNTMNALNMVILNGISGTAEFTCHQPRGSSVIDLACVDARILVCSSQFTVWDDEWSVDLSDHSLVSFDLDIPPSPPVTAVAMS